MHATSTSTTDPVHTAAAAPVPRRRTPGLLLGPYYPLATAGSGTQLWQGDTVPAGARRLRLDGCVVDRQGRPLAGVEVELWQADPAGRYRHPSAPETDQVPPGFAGHGRTRTDAAGAFRFDSLVPGAYADAIRERAPHLHLQLTGRVDRLVTQLFLPGDAGNQADHWFRSLRRPDLLTAEIVPAATPAVDGPLADTLHLRWTAVLGNGA